MAKVLHSVPLSVRVMHAHQPKSEWWDTRAAERLVSDPSMEGVWKAVSDWADAVRANGNTAPSLDRLFSVVKPWDLDSGGPLSPAQIDELFDAAGGELEGRTYLLSCIVANQWMTIPKTPYSSAKYLAEKIGASASRLSAKITEGREAIRTLNGSTATVDLVAAAFRRRNEGGDLSPAQEQVLATMREAALNDEHAQIPDVAEILASLRETIDRGVAPALIAPRPTKANAEDACRTYICQVLCAHFQFGSSLARKLTPGIPFEAFATLVNTIYNDKNHVLDAAHLKKLIKPQLDRPVPLADLGE